MLILWGRGFLGFLFLYVNVDFYILSIKFFGGKNGIGLVGFYIIGGK